MAPSQSYEREDKWLHYPLHNKQALPRQRLVRWGSCGWRYFSSDLQPLSGQEVLFQGVGQEQQGLRSLQLHRIFRHSSRKRFRCSDLPQQPWWQTHATKVRLWATDLTLHWLSGFLKFSLFKEKTLLSTHRGGQCQFLIDRLFNVWGLFPSLPELMRPKCDTFISFDNEHFFAVRLSKTCRRPFFMPSWAFAPESF